MADQDEDHVVLPAFARWELPTQRKYMPESLRRVLQANSPIIRIDQKAYDKHTIGRHPESVGYLRDLDAFLKEWIWVRPAPSGGGKWEIYIDIEDPGIPWLLVVVGESRGGINLVSIHLPRAGTVRNRLIQSGFVGRMEK